LSKGQKLPPVGLKSERRWRERERQKEGLYIKSQDTLVHDPAGLRIRKAK